MSPYRRYHRYDPRRYVLQANIVLGKRGTVLALLGMIWIAQGVSALVTPPSADHLLLNVWSWPRAAAWVATGIVALWCSRKPQGKDALGFLALYVMAAYRVLAYLVSFAIWLVPDDHGGSPRAVVGVMSWVTIIIFIVILAGWDEPDRTRRERRES